MKLHQAFGVTRGDVVAFIGAGGKTSTLINMGHELAELGWRVLATTTTAIKDEQLRLMPAAVHSGAKPTKISDTLSQYGFVFVYDRIVGDDVYGASVETIKQFLDNVDSDVLLIEADGADGMPLKAPYENEPIIPQDVTLVVPIASLSAINQPLDEEHIYNPQAMIEKYGYYPGSNVRSPWIAEVLRDEELGLRGIPDKARVVAFINQTPDAGYLLRRARLIAKLALKSPRLHGVALGSVRASDPIHELQRSVGAIVLAAGQSSRMGQPKVLLPWTDNNTIIEQIVHQLIKTRIDPINVVTGYYAADVKRTLKPLGVKLVHNRAHKTGEMLSSLKAGLRAMPDNVAAAFIVLGDQPRIQPRVITELLKAYAEGQGDIIAPSYKMRRGHPILVGRKYWSDFLALRNIDSPRMVFNDYADDIVYVDVNTDSVLRDVDTPTDYEEERFRAGLSSSTK